MVGDKNKKSRDIKIGSTSLKTCAKVALCWSIYIPG